MGSRSGVSRRHFLRAGTLAGGAVAAGSALPASTVYGAVAPLLDGPPLRISPIVERRGRSTVAICQQFPRRPVAYYDRRAGRIYVDAKRRAEVARLLDATVDGARWSIGNRVARQADVSTFDRQVGHAEVLLGALISGLTNVVAFTVDELGHAYTGIPGIEGQKVNMHDVGHGKSIGGLAAEEIRSRYDAASSVSPS